MTLSVKVNLRLFWETEKLMVLLLRGLFASMLVGMLVLTLIASWEQGLVPAARALWPDAWFRATLADA